MSATTEGPSGPASRIAAWAGPVLAICLLVCFAWILLPGGLRNPAPELEPEDDPTEFQAARGEKTEPLDMAAAFEPSADSLGRGRQLYAQVCVSCHRDSGRGDGPAGKALQPPARDFTSPDGWTNGTTVATLFRTLTEGIPGTSMVAYDYMPPRDRFALAHYVQALGDFDHGADTPAAVTALDEEHSLSEGVQRAHRVPVGAVVEKMSEEFVAVPALSLPPEKDASEGAALIRRLVLDPERAALTVHGLRGLADKPEAFAGAIIAGAPDNGFSPGVGTLTTAQWRSFHRALYSASSTQGMER